MPRVRPQLGLVFALLGLPQLARADAFVAPAGKSAVEATIAVENLDEHPQYLFVLWPDGCLHNAESFATYTLLNVADDDGREEFMDEGCVTQRLFAFPADTYAAVEGVLPETAQRQLRDEPPTDPRVLVHTIAGEQLWWVPDEVDLRGIEDVYRVAVSAGALTLTPTRVRFDFGDQQILERAFYKGRRPRLPRAQDIPPPPPPTPDAAPTASPIAEAPPTPALAAAPSATPPAPSPAPPPTTPVPARPPPVAPAEEISAEPWPPPALVYGGLCLLVALGAGLALSRRR